MSLNLTYAENADAALKQKRRNAPKILAAGVALLIFASEFGYVPKASAAIVPNPITCYPSCSV